MQNNSYNKIYFDSKDHYKHIENSYKAELFSLFNEVKGSHHSDDNDSDNDNELINILLVNYFNKTFKLIQPNIKINGQDFDQLDFNNDFEYEPFDDNLKQRMSELDSSIELLQTRLSSRRKQIPLELEELLVRNLKRQNESEEKEKEKHVEVKEAPEDKDIQMDQSESGDNKHNNNQDNKANDLQFDNINEVIQNLLSVSANLYHVHNQIHLYSNLHLQFL